MESKQPQEDFVCCFERKHTRAAQPVYLVRIFLSIRYCAQNAELLPIAMHAENSVMIHANGFLLPLKPRTFSNTKTKTLIWIKKARNSNDMSPQYRTPGIGGTCHIRFPDNSYSWIIARKSSSDKIGIPNSLAFRSLDPAFSPTTT